MKISSCFSLFAFRFSLFTLALSASAAHNPVLCNPYTFVGRIVDSHRVAFDADRTATLYARATTPASNLLARSTTFTRTDSPRNYALQIPMADTALDGYAVTNDTVSVSVVDDEGRTWSGVINPAVIGTPGTVSTVDIVLAEDADGDGIDDALWEELFMGWTYSKYWNGSDNYDPRQDTDGDGIPDLDEAQLGTNPFDPADVLAIQDFNPSDESISFVSSGGRAYTVEQTSDFKTWSAISFSLDETNAPPQDYLSIPASSPTTLHVLYLYPSASPAFFRITPQ